MRTIGSGRRVQRVNPPGRDAESADAESAPTRYQASFNAPYTFGAQTWTCPQTGEYTIYAWGRGGTGGTGYPGGGSGALAIWQRVRFQAGDEVVIWVPPVAGQVGQSTTVTTARKDSVLSAGAGGFRDASGGVAANGDININGSTGATLGTAGGAGGGTDGGRGGAYSGAAGAPGYDGLRGGDGSNGDVSGSTPGGGGAGSGDTTRPQFYPGNGLVIICRDK